MAERRYVSCIVPVTVRQVGRGLSSTNIFSVYYWYGHCFVYVFCIKCVFGTRMICSGTFYLRMMIRIGTANSVSLTRLPLDRSGNNRLIRIPLLTTTEKLAFLTHLVAFHTLPRLGVIGFRYAISFWRLSPALG